MRNTGHFDWPRGAAQWQDSFDLRDRHRYAARPDRLVVTVTFNDDGIVVSVAREDGVTAAISNSTTELDGDAVTITIGERTYTGTLSEDQNTIAGDFDQDITVGDGDVVITIPGGDFAIVRVPADPCDGVTCEDGESCVDGDCVADDPCDGVTCEADTWIPDQVRDDSSIS